MSTRPTDDSGSLRFAWTRFALALAVASAFLVAGEGTAFGQAGVLVPSSVSSQPNDKVLELTEMTVNVTVDHQLARTRVLQIYANRTDRPLEGTYVFAIPTTASIADFAVWDGDTRIPGVILEKRRARKIYEEIAARAIDPGLLEQEDEDAGTSAFTVRVAPVPAYGTKRIEIEYTELLPVDNLQSYYSFPLKPSQYGQQIIGHLRIDVSVQSGFPITGFAGRGQQFPLAMDRDESDGVAAHYEGTRVSAAEDFSFTYGLAVPNSQLDVIAYRAPERISASELRDPALAERQPDGYFQATAVFNPSGRAAGSSLEDTRPRSVVILMDTSLSMWGEKLEKSFDAMRLFLGALTPNDRFNVILFNDDVVALGEEPVAGTPAEIERALGFVRASYLSGGTNLEGALERGVQAAAKLPETEGGRAMVLLTDGNPTLSTTATRRLLETFRRANDGGPKVRLNVFGIGTDTRVGLLGQLAKSSRGLFVWARETEDLEFKLQAFFGKVGRASIEEVTLAVDGGDPYQVYPATAVTGYDGSVVQYFGRYKRPGAAKFTLRGAAESGPIDLAASLQLPERDDTHREVPRLWARARVDALLAQIDLNGETDEAISEIIALSKRYKFVTPYTSFLAAPRSLLRPRTIRPGDPVLRVATDPSIVSVVAVFPFGLVKPMRYLESEGVWETRFLAPLDMADGRYGCRLIMTDNQGRSFEEVKRFRIDSRPPALTPTASPATVRQGEEVTVAVAADADTRWIAARLFGAAPVRVVWDPEQKTNVGRLRIPEGLPPGRYTIKISAEDFARNGASSEVQIEVLAR